MQSHPVKRVVSGALAATAVIAAVTFAHAPAIASPTHAPQQPASTSEALAKYRELGEQGEKLNEDFLNAQEDEKAKQGELDKANQDLEAANKAEIAAGTDIERYRVDVDKFAGASFTSGAQLNKMSALLSSNSAQNFLDRSSALDVLATDKNEALQGYSGSLNAAQTAKQAATDAQGRAQAAKDEAARLKSEIESRKKALEEQKDKLEEQYSFLSSADKNAQRDIGADVGPITAPGPAAQTAVNAAMGKRGSAYVWAATGPSTFDCSGLTSWAYKQAGVSIPRTSKAQSVFGKAVSRDALEPGDLVFFGSPVHHVGIYIGGGNMVHAPTSGEVVKVSPIQKGYSGARRVA